MSGNAPQKSQRAPWRRSYDFSDRVSVGLIKLALRHWYGSVIIFLIGAAILAADIWIDSPSGRLLVPVIGCVGLLLAVFRHFIRKPGREWRDLDAAGRIKRFVLTVVMTAGFAVPVAWFVWWVYFR